MKFTRGRDALDRITYTGDSDSHRYVIRRAEDHGWRGWWTIEVWALVSVGTLDPIKIAGKQAGRTGLEDSLANAKKWASGHAENGGKGNLVRHVVSVNGGKVHTMAPGMDGHPYPLCRGGGMNQNLTKFTTTSAELTCKTCLTYAERRAEAEAKAEIKEKGTTMSKRADITTEDGAKAVEQIDANIDRVKVLASEGNKEGYLELASETEGIISSLTGKGSMALKKLKRVDLAMVSSEYAKWEMARKPLEGVVTKETLDYTENAAVVELVNDGAIRFAEGVQSHVKSIELARDVARMLLDIRLRMTDAQGKPDLKAVSPGSRAARDDMISKAGDHYRAANPGAPEDEIAAAMESLWRSARNQIVRVVIPEFIAKLEPGTEDAEAFAAIEPKEGQSLAEAVLEEYKFSDTVKDKVMALTTGEPEADSEESDEDSIGGGERTEGEKVIAALARYVKAPDSRELKKITRRMTKLPDDERSDVSRHLSVLIADMTEVRSLL